MSAKLAETVAPRKPKALILAGDGINCEQETAHALELVGFEPHLRHLNDLIAEHCSLDDLSRDYSTLALPGGFSFGDDLSSGKVLALKIQFALKWDLSTFASRGGLVIGICNGFQALLRMGLFGKDLSITHNQKGRFINMWVRVAPFASKCVWIKGLGTIDLPIRHGEGRIVFNAAKCSEVYGKLERQGMIALKYMGENPNGSENSIAGLCDPTGRIFGLMPHPEAFVRWTSYPEWTLKPDQAGGPGHGLQIFENAFQEVR